MPRLEPDNFARNIELLTRIEVIAAEKRVKTSQLALAWVPAKGRNIVPIPGTKHVPYLAENAAAMEISLTRDERARLDVAAPQGITAGERYSAHSMRILPAED